LDENLNCWVKTPYFFQMNHLIWKCVNLSPWFKSFGLCRNFLNPALRPYLGPNSDDSCVTWLTAARSEARLTEWGPKKIKPTLVAEAFKHVSKWYTCMVRIVNSFLKKNEKTIVFRFVFFLKMIVSFLEKNDRFWKRSFRYELSKTKNIFEIDFF